MKTLTLYRVHFEALCNSLEYRWLDIFIWESSEENIESHVSALGYACVGCLGYKAVTR